VRLQDSLAARGGYLVVTVGVVLLDQATKVLAHRFLRGRDAVEVVPGCFNLWYSRNAGGLFGWFREWNDPWRTLLLTLLPIAAIAFILRFLLHSPDEGRPSLLGLALILGGAVGNLIDRVLRGEVVDFLDVYAGHAPIATRLVRWFGTAHWPTFNVADSAIVVGAGLLLLHVTFGQNAPEQASV
jgi:signal peptidase II